MPSFTLVVLTALCVGCEEAGAPPTPGRAVGPCTAPVNAALPASAGVPVAAEARRMRRRHPARSHVTGSGDLGSVDGVAMVGAGRQTFYGAYPAVHGAQPTDAWRDVADGGTAAPEP